MSDRQALIQNIYNAIALAVAFGIFLFIFLPTQFIMCCNKDLREIVRPFSFFLAIAPAMLIYLIMFGKSNKIIDTLDYLHEVVVESTCMVFFPIVCILSIDHTKLKQISLIFAGSNLSEQLAANYKAIDDKHAMITIGVVKCAYYISVIELTLSFLYFPISYAIFHKPHPEKWTLPMDYKQVFPT